VQISLSDGVRSTHSNGLDRKLTRRRKQNRWRDNGKRAMNRMLESLEVDIFDARLDGDIETLLHNRRWVEGMINVGWF
jgi:hypothetical protein